jgi:hypothetical protein
MLIAVIVCALFAGLQLLLAMRVRLHVPRIEDAMPPPPATWPRLSMIVPARDEAQAIGDALRSKLACGYPAVEIVVVDDRSSDGTGEIARRLAAEDRRIAVARIDELPAGWLGKVHALTTGVERATGDWLLFSDADVHVAPGTLERAIMYAEANAVDVVAIMPRMDPVSLPLDACMAATVRMIMLVGRTWRANDDRSPVGFGVGAFTLVRRSALARTPGLAYLKMEVADDVALGSMIKASGGRCRLFTSREAVHLVFAERLGVLARSLEKGGGILGFSLWRTLLVAAAWLAVDLAIPVGAIACGGPAAVVGAIHLLALFATHAVLAGHCAAPLRGALAWPLGTVLSIAMFVRSGALAWWRGAIVWRATSYSRREIEAGRRWIGGRVRVSSIGTQLRA